MYPIAARIEFTATVQHTLVRADGSRVVYAPDTRIITKTINWWHDLWVKLKKEVRFFAGMTFIVFMMWATQTPQHGMWLLRVVAPFGIITSAGIDYLATTFVSNANPLINFNYHTYGTGDVHGSTSTPTNATAATPSVITQAGHPFFNNDIMKMTGITGITGVNGIWVVTYINSSSYSLLGSVGGGSGFGGGTNAAQLLNGQADTALTTEVASLTRVAGTQSNPTANTYKTTVAVPFTGTTPPFTIVEWGLFSAISSGTLWDRRWANTANAPSSVASAALVSAPITITSTSDSINTIYTLTCNAGGS